MFQEFGSQQWHELPRPGYNFGTLYEGNIVFSILNRLATLSYGEPHVHMYIRTYLY